MQLHADALRLEAKHIEADIINATKRAQELERYLAEKTNADV